MKKKKLSKSRIILELADNLPKYYLIIILFWIISGCHPTVEDKLSGTWSIKEMTVNKKNFLPYLYVNTFGFHSTNNSAWFQASYFFDADQNAKWLIQEYNGKKDSIKIKSKIKIYNDDFKIKIKKSDKTNQLHLIMESKSVYISAYKIIEDY